MKDRRTSRSSFSVMSDSMKPGQTALTVTPRAENSLALACSGCCVVLVVWAG